MAEHIKTLSVQRNSCISVVHLTELKTFSVTMVQWDGRGENEVEKQKQGIFLFFIGTRVKVLK